MIGMGEAGTVADEPQAGQDSRVLFRCAPELPWLVVPADVQVQWRIAPRLAGLPGVVQWCTGVVNERGWVLPVFDLACWARGAPTDAPAVGCILIGRGDAAFGLMSDAPPRLGGIAATASNTTEDTGPLAACLGNAVEQDTGEIAFEFDHARWLAGALAQMVIRN